MPDLPSARLIEMLERLPLMHGALSARATAEAQASQGTVSGVTVGAGPGGSSGPQSSATGSRRDDVEQVESSRAVLTGHPAIAGLVDFAQV